MDKTSIDPFLLFFVGAATGVGVVVGRPFAVAVAVQVTAVGCYHFDPNRAALGDTVQTALSALAFLSTVYDVYVFLDVETVVIRGEHKGVTTLRLDGRGVQGNCG